MKAYHLASPLAKPQIAFQGVAATVAAIVLLLSLFDMFTLSYVWVGLAAGTLLMGMSIIVLLQARASGSNHY